MGKIITLEDLEREFEKEHSGDDFVDVENVANAIVAIARLNDKELKLLVKLLKEMALFAKEEGVTLEAL